MVRRIAGIVVLILVLIVGAPVATASGQEWTEGPCPTASGVTVVVDFQELGGGVNVRCAPGAPVDGFDALRRADVNFKTATRSPGFLCQIAGEPSDDPCINTSPANRYWSYWLAPRGGAWCYAKIGAGARTPPEGTVEGWSFSLDKAAASVPAPRFVVPPAVDGSPTRLPAKDCDAKPAAPGPTVAPSLSPTPTPSRPTTSRPPATAPGAASSRSTGGPSATGGPVTSVLAPTDSALVTPNGDTTTTTSAPPGVAVAGESATRGESGLDPERAAAATGTVDLGDDGTDGGSPLALVVGVALIGLVSGGAFVMRRRRGPDG